MLATSFLLTLLAMVATKAAAQIQDESCPTVCDMDPVDPDRVISDCVAQCNTYYGDPDDAQICSETCADWQGMVGCEVTTITRRSLSSPVQRHRQDGLQTTDVFDYASQDANGADEEDIDIAAFVDEDDVGESLVARSDLSGCLASCRVFRSFAAFCPFTRFALASQATL